MTLIRNHVPTAWSLLNAYGNVPFTEGFNTEWRLVTPWLDHPPLFSLLTGIAGLLGGGRSLFDVTVASIRIPALLFSIGSIPLLYLITARLYATGVAIITCLVFATSPGLVYLSRLAVSENLIAFLCLLMLLCVMTYLQNESRFSFYLAAVVSGLASLAKVTGIFMVAVLFSLLAYRRKWKEATGALIVGLAIFSLYFAFGMSFDAHLFLSILREHAERFSDILIFQKLIVYEQLPFFDAWFAFGLCAFFASLGFSGNELDAFANLPLVLYILVLLATGAQSHFYPWYIIPLYPFLAIATGRFLHRFVKQGDFLSACLILICIGTWSLRYAGSSWHGYLEDAGAYRYKDLFLALLAAGVLPFFFHSILGYAGSKKIASAAAAALIIVCLTANVFIAYRFPVTLAGDKATRLFVRRELWTLRSDDIPIQHYVQRHHEIEQQHERR